MDNNKDLLQNQNQNNDDLQESPDCKFILDWLKSTQSERYRLAEAYGYPVEVIMREEIAFEYCQKIILNFNPNHWKVVSSSFVDPERNQEGLSLDFLKKLDFISCASHRVKNEFPLFNVQIYPFRSSESDHTLILLEIDTPAGIIYLLENEKYSNCFFKEVVDV